MMSNRRYKNSILRNNLVKNKKQLLSLIILLILLVALPFLYIASQSLQQFLSRAIGTKANITIDAVHTLESITQFWNSFAQGGEETKNMIAPVTSEVKNLSPAYIRIDHMFDHHNVVSRNSQGQLAFNFESLDRVVQSILNTGALPFFSLSYMPLVIAKNNDITQAPNNWNEWSQVVKQTIEHYSGKKNLNLSNIYYEVWNEPDLFGKWKYYGDKNYLTLYNYAVTGAQNATNTNQFKIGGPATTQLYKNWITALANYATSNNLRLDFFSWHRYTAKPLDYNKDSTDVTSWLFPYPKFVNITRIISEWGFDSEINSGYDTKLAAAHAVATIRQAINGYAHLFAFELVDGPDPGNRKYWGRWGLLTHPSTGISRKPRYEAFLMLKELKGKRLLLSGEGTWVSGIAAINEKTINIFLTNYDSSGRNLEQVPVKIVNLTNGEYKLITKRLGQPTITETKTVTDGTINTAAILTVNDVMLLQISPLISQVD